MSNDKKEYPTGLKTNTDRALFDFISNNLKISVTEGGFTDPNGRTIKLKLCGVTIDSDTIDIRTRGEYEG